MPPTVDHELMILDAQEQGYNMGYFDGIYDTEYLKCRCWYCLTAFKEGFGKGVDEALEHAEESFEPDERHLTSHGD